MQKQTIAVYMPKWLYRSDKTDQIFWDELILTINKSPRYYALLVDLCKLKLASVEDARHWCTRNRVAAVIQHHSHYYTRSSRFRSNVEYLTVCVPLINSLECHAIGHDKEKTKHTLAAQGIPVLPHTLVMTTQEFNTAVKDNTWYVIKPLRDGAGRGVKLVRRIGSVIEVHAGEKWRSAHCINTSAGISLSHVKTYPWDHILDLLNESDFVYREMLIEPYFNDHAEGFASLRCTVVGEHVVEAVERINHRLIASNVSAGGSARAIHLSPDQENIAIMAARAVGADYAGVDMLVCGGKTVVGEVNIGPFTVFSKYTNVPVGHLLAEHVLRRVTEL